MSIGPGDVVVCVDDSPCKCCSEPIPVAERRIYRVESVRQYRPEGLLFLFLVLVGVPAAPYHQRGVNIRRFRKIDRADEAFTRKVRACRPRTREVTA